VLVAIGGPESLSCLAPLFDDAEPATAAAARRVDDAIVGRQCSNQRPFAASLRFREALTGSRIDRLLSKTTAAPLAVSAARVARAVGPE
jgi:hypothetical protein